MTDDRYCCGDEIRVVPMGDLREGGLDLPLMLPCRWWPVTVGAAHDRLPVPLAPRHPVWVKVTAPRAVFGVAVAP